MRGPKRHLRLSVSRTQPEPGRAEQPGREPSEAPAPESASNDASGELRIIDREPSKFLYGQWQNITVLAWAAQADAHAIARLRRAMASVVGSHPGGRSTVSVIAEGLPPPTADARAGVVDLMNGDASDLACLAVVVNGTGFKSSVLRSVHTSMRNESQRSFEMVVLGNADELALWLPPRHLAKTGVRIDGSDLRKITCRALSEAAAGGAVEE